MPDSQDDGMHRIFDFLRTDDLPRVSARLYGVELRYYTFWALVMGAIEGNLAGIVVKKTFGASDLLTSIVWAAPIFVNTLNILWGVAIRGRRRLRMVVLLTSGAVLCISSIAITSPAWESWGGWIFALQIGLTHVFMSGLLTLRSSIWQANYPQAYRGRIIGRLQTIRFTVVPLSSVVIATLFDWDPGYYRFVYPAAALVGLLALVPLRHYRIRGERRELREYRAHVERLNGPVERGHAGLWAGLKEASAILRHDANFRRYMLAQFTLGSANFFTDPILVVVLTGQWLFGYLASNLMMLGIPGVFIWLSIRFWAPYFDRVGVVHFRVINTGIWIAAYVCVAVSMIIIGITGSALLWIAIPILCVGRMLNGMGRGGGAIAWSIGHLQFARQHQVDLYMSIHVALTGLRALVMPLLGAGLNQLLGNASFAVAVVISIAAHLLFRRLARLDREAVGPGATQARGREVASASADVT
jgi:hypothetical protein